MKTLKIKTRITLKSVFFATVLLVTASCTQDEIVEEELAGSEEEFDTSLSATTVDSTNHKEHDFDDSTLAPFTSNEGFNTGSGYGFSFVNSTWNGKMLKIEWKQSEYDGTRDWRGHEIKLAVTTNYELYCGFYWRGDKSTNIMGSDTIIWQLYNWNSDGCSNWTAHMELVDNDLYLSYRASCNDPTVVKIYDNLANGTNHRFQIRSNVSGNNTGRISVRLNGTTIANETGINLGFGDFYKNDNAKTSVVGVKMGIYAYDFNNYDNNEKRTLYLDNIGVSVRSGTIANSWDRIDPANGN